MIVNRGNECIVREGSDSESEDESETSESEEELDLETTGLDLDVCPPGCDQNLYDNTCFLREKRVDVEEQLAEERRNKDSIIRELDTMQKKAKVAESAMKTVEQELQAAQVAMFVVNISLCYNLSSNIFLKTDKLAHYILNVYVNCYISFLRHCYSFCAQFYVRNIQLFAMLIMPMLVVY